ncbi:MAG: class I SAM-dependent methyltransferase [Alphaproteobacteria bacterium]
MTAAEIQSAGDSQPLAPCPLCGAASGHIAQNQRLALAGLGSVSVGFGYCGECGHIYQVKPPTEAQLAKHYEQFSNYTALDPQAARKAPPTRGTLRLLALAEAHSVNRGLIYEVGCAIGAHLNHFRRAGWQVSGCDPSPKACAQAKAIHGIEIDCGTEAEILPRRSELDIILFSHVLEHLSDPISALRRAREALADDGRVVLEVPCAIAPNLLPPGWFTFEHLNYFSETGVMAMLAAAGLEPLEMRIVMRAEIYPVIGVAAAKAAHQLPVRADPPSVERTRAFLTQLVARDNAQWNATSEILSGLNGPIYLWAAGVHTAQLFDRTAIESDAEVIAIVDSDSQKWGQFQAGYEIISPAEFRTRHKLEPIIVSSYAAETKIAQSLLDVGVPAHQIIKIYT